MEYAPFVVMLRRVHIIKRSEHYSMESIQKVIIYFDKCHTVPHKAFDVGRTVR